MAEQDTVDTTPPPAPPPPAAPKPGGVLRGAREARGLSLDEMVVQTKLPRATLEAIESDDFAVLSEPVYVRGYYRKYARVVGAPEDEIIAGYEAHAGGLLPKPEVPVLLQEEPIGSGRWKAIVAVIALIVVVGVLVAWLVSGDDASEQAAADAPGAYDTTESADQASANATEPQGDNGSAASTSATRSPRSSGPFAGAGGRGASVDESAQAEGSGRTPVASGQPSTVGRDANRQPAESDDGAEAGSAAESPAGNEPSPSQSAAEAPTADALVLTFNEASWVRVEDANGRRVLNGLIQAGETRELTDAAPYSVFLGYAPGVSVSYQGESVDVAPYVRGNNTARFTVE